ncbi:MAG: hypothetical protein WBM02_02655 [bacterium]
MKENDNISHVRVFDAVFCKHKIRFNRPTIASDELRALGHNEEK